MRSPVYNKIGTSVPPRNEFSTSSQHPLELFAEDQLTITHTFLRHLAQCRLSQRRFQIVLAIFNQTVGFHKFEDDMNGTRLQQLTGLLPNHANATVRELAQLNVLIIRKGHYGHYLAINYNFSQWGQQDSDANDATIDPCDLLPDDEAETILNTDNSTEEVTVEPDVKPLVATETTPTLPDTNDQAEPHPQHWHMEALQQLLQPLIDRLDTLSDRVEQLEQASKTKTTANDNEPINEEKPAEAAITSSDQTVQTVQRKPVKQPTNSPTNLQCPATLSPQKHQEAKNLAAKAGDQAQLLLDMLNQRMKNTSDPLRNPIAYLDTLVQKQQAGRLTLPSTSASTFTTEPAQPRQPSQAESCENEYREARADRMQMENTIKLLAQTDQLSFDEAVVKLGLGNLWEGVKTRFTQTKAALEALCGEGQVVVV